VVSRIYLASSWRNERQPAVVALLRGAGHEVYDFRNPRPGQPGFRWSEVDPGWQEFSPEAFRAALAHPSAVRGYARDFDAMQWADTCVLLLPCGRSAHLEAGWFAGAGRRLVIMLAPGQEPDLMYKLASTICVTEQELLAAVNGAG
jgi:hypothetical protein